VRANYGCSISACPKRLLEPFSIVGLTLASGATCSVNEDLLASK
jgi:hypothetical protein